MEYCLNLFRHVSITADSWSNKNAFATSRYWLQKLFLTLERVQNSIVLVDWVWLDETCYSVRSENIVRKEGGDNLRGLSQNQDLHRRCNRQKNTIFLVEGTGKPSQKKTLAAFRNHIKPGAALIHDRKSAHSKLIRELFLERVVYGSKDFKGLPDKKTTR